MSFQHHAYSAASHLCALCHYPLCATHLVTSRAAHTSTVVRNGLKLVQYLCTFYKVSGKFKCLYLREGSSKPDRIEKVHRCLLALRAAEESFGTSTVSRASSLEQSFSSPKNMGNLMALILLEAMVPLDVSLQYSTDTVQLCCDTWSGCATVLICNSYFNKTIKTMFIKPHDSVRAKFLMGRNTSAIFKTIFFS